MFQTVDKTREHLRAATARDLANYYAELSAPNPAENFNLLKVLRAMSEQTFLPGSSYEANVVQAAAVSQGADFNPQSVIIPWGALAQRDLTVATPTAGGRLVGANTSQAVDALRPHCLAARLGVKFAENQMQDLLTPNVTTPTTGVWLANEASQIPNSDPVINLNSSKPKTAGALIKASFNFMRQSGQSEQFIRGQLLECMGGMLDAALFAGTGADGQPTGLDIAAGIPASSGVFNLINGLAMETEVSAAVGDDSALAFATTPVVRGLLKQAPGTFNFLWNNDKLVDRPGYVSSNVPTSRIFLGDWKNAQITLWGAGLQIDVDPYSGFKSGSTQVRILMHADITILKPTAFFKWTSV